MYGNRNYRSRSTYRMPTYRNVRSREHRMHSGCLAAVLGVMALVAYLCWAFVNYEYGTEHHVTFTVTQVTDQATSKGHRYLIYGKTPAGQLMIFENTDALFHGKTNSTDLQASLRPGMTVDCNVYGWRNHFLSGYPDLLACTSNGQDVTTISGINR